VRRSTFSNTPTATLQSEIVASASGYLRLRVATRNPHHDATTGPEIWDDTDMELVDAVETVEEQPRAASDLEVGLGIDGVSRLAWLPLLAASLAARPV